MHVRPFSWALAAAAIMVGTPGVAAADTHDNGWLLGAEEMSWDATAPTTTARASGTVGLGDEFDFYTVTVAKFQRVELEVHDDTGCPEIALRSDSDGLLQIYDDEPTRVMVRVRYVPHQCGDRLPADGKMPYSFSLRFENRVPADPLPAPVRESEPNDSLETAGVAQNGVWYRGRSDGLDDPDWYTFWVPPGPHVLYWQVLGVNEQNDGESTPAAYAIMDSPSMARYREPHYDSSTTACQNCRKSFFHVAYGPEQVWVHMPGMRDRASWAFSVTANAGSMLTAPYGGPIPPEFATPPPSKPEIEPQPLPVRPPPITNARIPAVLGLTPWPGTGVVPDAPSLPPIAPEPLADLPSTPRRTIADATTPNGPSVDATSARSPGSPTTRRCTLGSSSVKRGRPLTLRCSGLESGTKVQVRWSRGTKTITRAALVRRGVTALSTKRLRGRYAVRIRSGTTKLAAKVITVR